MDNTAIVAVCLGAVFFLIMGASLFWSRKRQERVAERMREKLGFRGMHLATGEKVRVIKPPLEHLRKHSPVDACAQASKPKKRGRPKNSKNKPRKRTAKRPKKKR